MQENNFGKYMTIWFSAHQYYIVSHCSVTTNVEPNERSKHNSMKLTAFWYLVYHFDRIKLNTYDYLYFNFHHSNITISLKNS